MKNKNTPFYVFLLLFVLLVVIIILYLLYDYATSSPYLISAEKAKKLIPERYYGLCRWMSGGSEPAVVTLEKMRWGSGYVIGNSSFSWWGAFLSHTKNAPTVAPKPWFDLQNIQVYEKLPAARWML